MSLLLPTDCLLVSTNGRTHVVSFKDLEDTIEGVPDFVRLTTVRVVTAAGDVTISATTDSVVVINKTIGAATAVHLPPTPVAGLSYTVKDGKGDANSNNITVTPASGTVDGASSFIIDVNYQTATFMYNGTQWNVF